MFKKISLLIISFFLFSHVLVQPIYASDSFDTDYDITYTINESGNSSASFDVSLTNTTSQYYASIYKLELGFQDITNLKASDPDGPIIPVITKTATGQIVELTFNKKVVGLNSVLPFRLTFDTHEIATKHGNIWEVNIPGVANQEDFTTFQVKINVPQSFGSPSYIKPKQKTNSLIFTKEQLGTAGISLAFGNQQLYDFDLMYHLQNKNLFPVKTEIALPPTTNYQDVFIKSITPEPENVTIDDDGNWLAQYYISPSKKLNVRVIGNATVSLSPKKQPLTNKQREMYTQPTTHWQSTSATVKNLGEDLKTPRAIYNFVVERLTYDFSRVSDRQSRLGAQNVLKNPTSAVCLEFTDLFIGLARAAGIPAREVNGFAATENTQQRPLSLVKDILHAWPEYYDDTLGTWIMIDPTWGNTTGGIDYFDVLDFDHLAFVIKGKESTYPVPAGGYKLTGGENKKDVFVTFGKTIPQHPVQASIVSELPKQVLSGFPFSTDITIRNTGSALLTKQQVSIFSSVLSPQPSVIAVSDIPPFGFAKTTLSFQKTAILTNKRDTITIRVGDSEVKRDVYITPFILEHMLIGGGVILVLFTIILFIYFAATRRIRIF